MIDFKKNDKIKKIEKEVPKIVEETKKIMIKNNDDLKYGTEVIVKIKKSLKNIEENRKFVVAPIDEAKKRGQAFFKSFSEPLKEAHKNISEKIVAYETKREKILLEQQRKLEEKARREEEKRKAELEKQAKKWEEKGNLAKAEERREIKEETIVPIAIVPQAENMIKVDGGKIHKTKDIDVAITDMNKFCYWLYQQYNPGQYINIKIAPLKSLIKQTGKAIPGVRHIEKTTISTRTF